MKKILIILFIISVIFMLIKNEETVMIPDESIRFRVIANSNDKEDITIKEYLTKKIIDNNKELFESKSINDSRQKINNSIDKLNLLINNTFSELNYNKDYKVNYGINYFPEKKYKGIKYKEGYYESLVVTIGEGKGNNYFCVMYPPLCLIDESNLDDVEYKFKIIEILEKFIIKK